MCEVTKEEVTIKLGGREYSALCKLVAETSIDDHKRFGLTDEESSAVVAIYNTLSHW